MNGENPLSVIHQGGVADVQEGRPVPVLGIDLARIIHESREFLASKSV
jgi:hypothetical protein